MLFWHVGATTAFIRYAFRDPAMDLRFLALGAVAPDLIDLPLGVALWSTHASVRLFSHSIVFASMVMVAVLVLTRRGANRKRWMLFAVGILLHLLLDAMWRSPETLWWPFLGTSFAPSGFTDFGSYAAAVISDPLMWAGELAGFGYLALLWRRSGLWDASARKVLFETGAVSARID